MPAGLDPAGAQASAQPVPQHRAATGEAPLELDTAWWLASAMMALGLVLSIAMFSETAQAILRTWLNDSSFGHGFLIIPISLWLIWQRREALARLRPAPAYSAILVVGAATGLWLLARLIAVQVIAEFALVTILIGIVVSALGYQVTRAMLFPLLFLFFMVPAGDGLVPRLQEWTTDLAVDALRLTGEAVYRDGFIVTTPSGVFAVQEACSGLRFVIATLTLSTLVAQQFFCSWLRRLLFMALALVVPVLANGIRVYGIIRLADVFGTRSAASIDHTVYGWIFLSAITALLLLVAWWFQEPADHRPPLGDGWHGRRRRPSSFAIATVVPIALCVASTGAFADWIVSQPPATRPTALKLPGGSPAPEDWADPLPWQPVVPGADIVDRRVFLLGERGITRFVAFCVAQRPGAKATSEANQIVPVDWTIERRGTITVPIDGAAVSLTFEVASSGKGPRRLVVWGYWVDRQFTGGLFAANLLQLSGIVHGTRAAALIAASTVIGSDGEIAASAAIRDFLAAQKGLGAALRAAETAS